MEAVCRVKLPVPRWLLPPPLIRWLVPKLISKVFWPKLVAIAHDFDASPFGERFREDRFGFYRACAARLPLVTPVEGGAALAVAKGTTERIGNGDRERSGSSSSDAAMRGVSTTAAPPPSSGAAPEDHSMLTARSPSGDFDDLSPDVRGAALSAEKLALVAGSGSTLRLPEDDDESEEPPSLGATRLAFHAVAPAPGAR